MAELARHGKGINSPEVVRLQELLGQMDSLVQTYDEEHADGTLSIDFIRFDYAMEALQRQLHHEFQPYFDAMHRRYVCKRRFMKIVGVLLGISLALLYVWIFFAVLTVLTSPSVERLFFRLSVGPCGDLCQGAERSGLVLLLVVVLMSALGAGFAKAGERIYARLHRTVTGYEPPDQRG